MGRPTLSRVLALRDMEFCEEFAVHWDDQVSECHASVGSSAKDGPESDDGDGDDVLRNTLFDYVPESELARYATLNSPFAKVGLPDVQCNNAGFVHVEDFWSWISEAKRKYPTRREFRETIARCVEAVNEFARRITDMLSDTCNNRIQLEVYWDFLTTWKHSAAMFIEIVDACHWHHPSESVGVSPVDGELV